MGCSEDLEAIALHVWAFFIFYLLDLHRGLRPWADRWTIHHYGSPLESVRWIVAKEGNPTTRKLL